MRGAYLAAGEAEALAASLWSLAERDGFYESREAFDAQLKFIDQPDAVRIEVYGELGENLLVWARQKGVLKLKWNNAGG